MRYYQSTPGFYGENYRVNRFFNRRVQKMLDRNPPDTAGMKVDTLLDALARGEAPEPWVVGADSKDPHDREGTALFTLTNAAFPKCEVKARFTVETRKDDGEQGRRYAYLAVYINGMQTEYISLFNASAGNFSYILKHFANLCKSLETRRNKLEKERKILNLTQNTVALCVEEAAKRISLPYRVDKMATKLVFTVRLPNNTKLSLHIPYKHFQEGLPSLVDTVEKYIALQRESKFKAIIANCVEGDRWNIKEGK
jgi:hypothetical protein